MKTTTNFEFDLSDRPSRNAAKNIQIYLNLLNHILVSIVAVYMTFLCYNAGNTGISWHAWLCTIGVSNSIETFNFININKMVDFSINC